MPNKTSGWMYYTRGDNVERDDNNERGYARKSDAEHDEAEFKRTHPSVLTRVYNTNGLINGKSVNWWVIIYKTRIVVKEEHSLRWNIGIEIEEIKSKRIFIEREQILAKNKEEIARHVKNTKWARDKRYKIIKIHADKATNY